MSPFFSSVDPFSKKDWYDVKAPAMFNIRNLGKTLVTRTQGTSEWCWNHFIYYILYIHTHTHTFILFTRAFENVLSSWQFLHHKHTKIASWALFGWDQFTRRMSVILCSEQLDVFASLSVHERSSCVPSLCIVFDMLGCCGIVPFSPFFFFFPCLQRDTGWYQFGGEAGLLQLVFFLWFCDSGSG